MKKQCFLHYQHSKIRVFFILAMVWFVSLCFVPLSTEADTAGSVICSVRVSVCGNEVTDTGEVCDDGDNNGQYGFCKSDCSGLGPYCGDGDIQTEYEECDDGNNVSGDDCSATCEIEAPAPRRRPSGGGGAVTPTETKVILQGKAYPSAKITVLVDGRVAANITADSLANFKKEITNISAGTYNFGLWAEDKEGRRSITFSFSATVVSGLTITIFDIFIPPTIELEKVNLLKGETLKVSGQTAPESEVSLHVESPQEIVKKTIAEEIGDWNFLFDTDILEEGTHITRAKAETPDGLLSSFSSVLAFYIGKYGAGEISPRADFNRDGRTNLIDFSIMLYWWGKYNPAVDMNQDGIVNLPDFSILMYYWTG